MPKHEPKPTAPDNDEAEGLTRSARVLLLDIEITPLKAWSWGPVWKTNLIEITEESLILSFSAKWMNGAHVTKGWPDYAGYKPGKMDDRAITRELWGLLDEADVVVAHNGDRFDVPTINARMSYHKLPPPSPYKRLDTRKAFRKTMKLPSNRLQHIGKYYGVGQKLPHEGFPLWVACMNGDARAWKKMLRYNRQDVALLEKVYLIIRPWMPAHPSLAIFRTGVTVCPRCGSTKFMRRGIYANQTRTYQVWRCTSCQGQMRAPLADPRGKKPMVSVS